MNAPSPFMRNWGKARRKLTDAQVYAIRRAAKQGESKSALARAYNVSPAAIGRVVSRMAYTHLLDCDDPGA